MDTIYNRRSIRRFNPEPVPQDVIIQFIKAGMNAPSAGNEQPWHFVVLDKRSILDEIPKFHPYAGMLREAPAAILVCGDLKLEKHRGCWVLDCAAATENMLLEITDRNFGGVWLGIYPHEERIEGMIHLLGLPETVIPFSLVAVGTPAEHKGPKNVFNMERIRFNGWET
jgi:nitroreductase